MLYKAEMYSSHRLVAKVKIYKENKANEITVISRQRNEFLFFYPHEDFKIHYMDDSGTVFVYDVVFKEVKMIRNTIYYLFCIQETRTFHNLRNEKRKSVDFHALLFNHKRYEEVQIVDLSTKGMKILSSSPLEKECTEVVYYIGKCKYAVLGKILWEKRENDVYFYGILIQRKEVI